MDTFKFTKITVILALLGLPFHSVFAVNKKDVIDTCVKTGDSMAVCECVSEKWLDSLTSQETKLAEELLDYMKTDIQPTSSDMQKYSSVMNKYRKLGMQCAMNVSTSVEEEEEEFDLGAFIPKGAMSAQDMKDFNAIVSGKGNVMDKLKSMDKRDQQRRDIDRQERATNQATSDAEIAKLRAQYKAEQKRVESRPILSQRRQDFKSLFDLHSKVYGIDSSSSNCLWDQLMSVTNRDEPSILAVYFASIGGGDFDQPPEHRPHMDQAFNRYQKYQDKRAMCD